MAISIRNERGEQGAIRPVHLKVVVSKIFLGNYFDD